MRSILFVILLFLMGCRNDDWKAYVPPIPSQLDTLYDQGNIPKVRRIFRSGVSYHYRAQYFDRDGQIISDNTASIIPTGQRWGYDPETQDAVIEMLGYTEEEKARVLANPPNRTLDMAERWGSEMQEGVIENTERIWMHPIRMNQYVLTQVSPFPEIRLPPEIGYTWKSMVSGLEGWGDWDGMTIESEYRIKGKEKVKLDFGKVDCWVIEAKSTFDLGENQVTFYFQEDLGFVKMEYLSYQGQRLVFTMESVVAM